MPNRAKRAIVQDWLVLAFQKQTERLDMANRLLRQGRRDLAVEKFHEAAEAEERLAGNFAEHGDVSLRAQALLSAGSCWLMAGEARAAVSAFQLCIGLLPGSDIERLVRDNLARASAACVPTQWSKLDNIKYVGAEPPSVSLASRAGDGKPGLGSLKYLGREYSTACAVKAIPGPAYAADKLVGLSENETEPNTAVVPVTPRKSGI